MATDPVCLKDFENIAANVLSRSVHGFYAGGSFNEVTLRRNQEAFGDIKLYPKFLSKSVTKRILGTNVLGGTVSFPVGVAPTAMHKLAHPDGELATARACEKLGTIMIVSTMSTTSMEEIALASPKLRKWFQLYIQKDRSVTEALIKRAERNGFEALVLTVDLPVQGIRYQDDRNRFLLPSHLSLANFPKDFSESMKQASKEIKSRMLTHVATFFDSSLTWKDVLWLKSITNMKVIIKGILTPDDALQAINHGAAAIIVSNHGGRQLDTVPATIEVLEHIVHAVNGRCEVYLDGGIRTGTDVLKALALGAKAVFIGRPVLWGLAYDGQNGVEKVLGILRNELDVAMALTTSVSITDITSSLIKPGSKL